MDVSRKYMIEVMCLWQQTDMKTFDNSTLPKFTTRNRVEHLKGRGADYDDIEEVYGCKVHDRGDVE